MDFLKNIILVYAVFKRPTLNSKTQGKRQEKYYHANSNQKRAGMVTQTSDKIDFKTKIVTRDKMGHFILIKGLTCQ